MGIANNVSLGEIHAVTIVFACNCHTYHNKHSPDFVCGKDKLTLCVMLLLSFGTKVLCQLKRKLTLPDCSPIWGILMPSRQTCDVLLSFSHQSQPLMWQTSIQSLP